MCTCKPAYDFTDRRAAGGDRVVAADGRPRLGGRPLIHSRRLVVDPILYVLVTGCAWRLVPHDLAHWATATAYRWFAAWTADGTWALVHDTLRR